MLKIIRLTSCQDIIADIEETEDRLTVTLINPHILIYTGSKETGKSSLALAPFFPPYSKELLARQ